MGSTGQTIGAVAGGIIGGILGYFGGNTVGGAMMGASIGMAVGSAVDPPGAHMGSNQYKQQDMYYNTIAHNLPVPIVYGVNRVAGNLLWLGNVSANVTQSGGGGKEGGSGGGGKDGTSGAQQVNVYGDFAVAISEGEILAVTEVFIGDKVISQTEGLTYTVYLGTADQTPDPRLVTDLGDLAPTFRHTAYLAMGGNLGSYPAIPQVNCEVVGKFTEPYSWGNPALIVQDILVHPRYGINVTSARIDQITFTAAYSYCVGMVPYKTATGAVGYEQRFTLDYIVDNYRPVVEHLRDMLSAFGGFLTWSQGIVKMHIDQPGATVTQSFGMGEISTDSFRWKRQSYRERPNVVRVQYVEPGALTPTGEDPSVQSALLDGSYIRSGSELSDKKEYKTYRQDFVEASDIWDIERTGERRDRVLNLNGIKRRTQAQRMAQYYLNKAVHCSNACAFRVGVNALQAEVGDVIAVSHDIPRWQGKLFKIAEIQEAESDELTLGCLEHSEAVYADGLGATPHGQDTLYGTSGATGGPPTNVGRLSVYERPYEDTLEVAYTRVATDDLFSGVDLYVQRGAGDFVGIAQNMLSNAPTAYLKTAIQTLTLETVGVDSSMPITIHGVPDGYSARLIGPNYYPNSGDIHAQAVASMGTIVMTPSTLAPGSGHLRLYSNGVSYSTWAANGRYPATTGVTSYQGGDVWDYRRIPQVITATQTWIPIDRPVGGWTNGESLRIETEEIGYTTFTDSMLTGVTRGAHGTTAAQHTGIVSLGMVAWEQNVGDALTVLTAEFRDHADATAFFTVNSTHLYVGASSKFSAMNLWLARNASQMLGLAGHYSTGAGTWVSLMSSSFIPAQDTTSGMQTSGQISWEPPGNWSRTHEVTLGGLNIGDATDRYYVRLMRVASLCVTPPAELEMTLTNDVLAVVRKPSAYLYELTLADSGQTLTFKAISRSLGGLAGESVAAPTVVYANT